MAEGGLSSIIFSIFHRVSQKCHSNISILYVGIKNYCKNQVKYGTHIKGLAKILHGNLDNDDIELSFWLWWILKCTVFLEISRTMIFGSPCICLNTWIKGLMIEGVAFCCFIWCLLMGWYSAATDSYFFVLGLKDSHTS